MNYVEHLNLFGIEAKEIPCITDSGVPTTATVGAVGMFYMNTDNGDVYKCTAVSGNVYTWESMNSSSQSSGGNVSYEEAQNLTDAQKAQARENIGAQPAGNYLTEVPEGYAKTEDIPTDVEIIQLIKDNAPESSGGGISVTGAKVGQTVKISSVDEKGVPTAWMPADFPSGGGGGSGGDVWEEITVITLTDDTSRIEITQDKNGNAFALKKLLVIFKPSYNTDKKTVSKFRFGYKSQTGNGLVDIALSETRTHSAIIYMDEVQIIGSSYYDEAITGYETYHIATKRVVRSFFNEPINNLWSEYPNVTYYAGTNITIWGVRV